jgi:hypothetical protein
LQRGRLSYREELLSTMIAETLLRLNEVPTTLVRLNELCAYLKGKNTQFILE